MYDTNRKYEMLIRPKGRGAADEYFHEGSIWIEGREGSDYTIELRNHTPSRVLFILSVDGLDVLEGQPAGLTSQGYVVPAYQVTNVPGWRINGREAAEFFFSRSRESYVNNIGGSTANTGVIGAMVFSEYQAPGQGPFPIAQYYSGTTSGPQMSSIVRNTAWVGANLLESSERRIDSNTVKAATAMLTSNSMEVKTSGGIHGVSVPSTNIASNLVTQDVGTGFGASTDWCTSETVFRRANPSMPDCVLAIYYNTARNLEKMGIRLRRKRDVSYKADPFPAYSSPGGCKPPPGWQG